ncbi:MAG: tetratricopeptide repeat protein [Candidatus Portnoybacteria bacterium]|nr:tetratricopeptide repeat protein [Candidatus Portnoybacteria bacterium]
MPLILILGIIFTALGAAGLVTVGGKKIPLLVKLSASAPLVLPGEGLWESVKLRIKGLKYSSFFPSLLGQLEKNLRKIRIVILKIDNLATNLIKNAREKSDVWTVRSHAWMEHRKMKKKERTHLLEKLDKMEVSETLQKISQEVAKDEDVALRARIASLANGKKNGEEETPVADMPIQPDIVSETETKPEESEITEEAPVGEDEKKYIDRIAQNPKDAEAYRALGFIYLEQGNFSDARACLRQVLKFKPEDETVKQKLEQIKGLRSKKGKAGQREQASDSPK